MSKASIVIGGASGYWGEATHATAQLLTAPDLDYLIYDYLAEITLSIMARARLKDSQSGFATDFVTDALVPNLQRISGNNVKVISNAGGMNPRACARLVSEAVSEAGLTLRVAVVDGDDLMSAVDQLSATREMFSDEPFPDAKSIVSANAYLGAFPIAAALDAGADIVITGRCVDSALTLAACIHEFRWLPHQFDLLAAGSLAGHLIECGPQLTGGNFTDWRLAGDFCDIGYPLARVSANGECQLSKPDNTSGVVSPLTAAEQMLYEIGDPTAYKLPDVVADFSGVTFTRQSENSVLVNGARGRSAPTQLKASVTWRDGFRAGYVFTFNGVDASAKAIKFAHTGLERARRKLKATNLEDFSDTCIEVWGGEPVISLQHDDDDAAAPHSKTTNAAQLTKPGYKPYLQIMLKTAVRHADAAAVNLFLKETMGAGLSGPPGLAGFTGAGRPRPSPVVRLFSCLVDRSVATAQITIDDKPVPCTTTALTEGSSQPFTQKYSEPTLCSQSNIVKRVPLETIAVARSGDKGDTANIGVVARQPEFLPWIWQAIDETAIRNCFGDLLQGQVHRYYLPGSHSMNIVLEQALGGGGVVSLRNDAQGKGYAQMLLAVTVAIPANLLDR